MKFDDEIKKLIGKLVVVKLNLTGEEICGKLKVISQVHQNVIIEDNSGDVFIRGSSMAYMRKMKKSKSVVDYLHAEVA